MAAIWNKKKEHLSRRPSRRPSDTPLKQQRMKAWQPVFVQSTSIKAFLAVGFVFLSMGIFWATQNKKISELRINYTQCGEIDLHDEPEVIPSENINTHFRASTSGHPLPRWKRTDRPLTFDGVTKNYTLCTITFFLPDDVQPPVPFHYHLTNFHQNHRKYITSLDKTQLQGENVSLAAVKNTCFPVTSGEGSNRGNGDTEQMKVIYPCGAIANSFFNDTYASPQRLPGGLQVSDASKLITYNMTKAGIASQHDKHLFAPTTYPVSSQPGGNTNSAMVPPPNWAERFPNGYHWGNMFNPADDEPFMVWMRTAASPSFVKLAMRNDQNVMKRGLYQLQVFSHFPAHLYDGTKSIIISSASTGVSRKEYLSIACLTSGAISIILTAVVALSALHKQQPLKDHNYLRNSQ